MPKVEDAKTETRPGFNKEGQRVSLTYEGAIKEFGEDRGALIYGEVARAGGYFDPNLESAAYRPPLDLSGLKDEHKTRVDAILSGKE